MTPEEQKRMKELCMKISDLCLQLSAMLVTSEHELAQPDPRLIKQVPPHNREN